MSDIERYVPVIRMAPEGSNAATMREYNSGKYVLYSDHEKQLATLREALETIVGSVGDNGTEARNRARQALEIDK